MHLDPALAVAGFVVGLLVGLTGMGGGALLTPLLVLFFRVAPLAAVSSDLMTSLIMKPFGAAVHVRHRTVHWRLVGWLAAGAVPAGFAGAVVAGLLGHSAGMQDNLKIIIGVALCASVATTVLRQVLDRRSRLRELRTGRVDVRPDTPVQVRPLRTVAIGVVGGLAVGITSVGAGSLIIALLLLAYPEIRPAQLVGTDIVQAIPLVAAATLGHLLFGDVQLALTASLLLGAIPGVYLGARLSAQGPSAIIRPVVAGVLLASALALLQVGTTWIVVGAVAGIAVMVALRPPRGRVAGPPAVPTDATPGGVPPS